MTNLLLLDLDGTVRRCKSDPAAFINLPQDQEIIPEAAAALERFASIGAVIVGCANQPGVHAGYKTLGECIDEQVETMRLAPQIRAILFAPDADGSRCFHVTPDGSTLTIPTGKLGDYNIQSFRKPACGMLLAAMMRYGGKAGLNVMFVGDREEDRLAAMSAGVPYISEKGWWNSYPEGTQPEGEHHGETTA